MREMLRDEGEEDAPGTRHQEQNAAAEIRRAVIARSFGESVEARFVVGDEGHDRVWEDADRNTGIGEGPDGFEAKVRPRRAGFEQTGEVRIQRGDGDVHADGVSFCNFGEQRNIARHEIGFGGDGERRPAVFGEDFEGGPGALEAAFGGLVRVRCSADGDAGGAVDLHQFPAQNGRQVRFGVDLVFEFGAVAQFHELVGVAGVAIPASEFAPAIGIESPLKRHSGPGPVQHAFAADFEILDDPLRFQNLARGGKFGDPDQARRGRIAEQHPSSIRLLFAYCQGLPRGFGLPR
jgi:hypothetical protein